LLRPSLWAPLLAAFAAVAVWLLRLRGADVPAQTYYVDVFRQHGWVLWDNGWYSGHFQVSYSILFPALGGTLGLYGAALLCAATSAWAFARLISPDASEHHAAPVLLFAAGTIVAVAIGQLPFLAGLAVALLALLAARREHFLLAAPVALASSLFSEVAAVFLILALATWAIRSRRAKGLRLALLGLVAASPLIAQSMLLPTLGAFPFAGVDLAVLEAVCVLGILWLPKRYKTLRMGLALYGATAVAVFVIPNPLGGNYARAVLYFAPALFAFLASIGGRRWIALLVIPMLCWQFVPASSALAADPSAERAYFTPLVDYLTRRPVPGRVEIPFTSAHWEAAYVAPHVPLARGWLRQLDIRDNSLFYGSSSLNATTYHHWLVENGVSWVALPDVPLDYSSLREQQLLRHGLPYLRRVWHTAHWQVWKVTDSPGLVSGPARLVTLGPDHLSLDVSAAGTALVRVHYTSTWEVTVGSACIVDDRDWTEVVIRRPGRVDLTTSILPTSSACA
jgi:hypothetical protein